MPRRPLIAIIALATVLFGHMVVHAQATAPGYGEAITQALTELEANNYPEAREEFRRAHAIFPNARTLRGLGMVEFELRNYVQSVQLLEQALAANVKPLDGKLRTDTEALLARAQRYVGEVVLDIEPRAASVTLDGADVTLDAERYIRLEVGKHTLTAQAPGHISERHAVQVVGGERAELRIRLGLLEAPLATTSSSTPAAPPERRPVYKKWWLWTTVAVVVAGGAAAAAILLTGEERKERPVAGTNTVGVNLQTLGRF